MAALYTLTTLLKMHRCGVRKHVEELVTSLHDYGVVTMGDSPTELKSAVLSHVYAHGRNDLTENSPLLSILARKIAKQAKKKMSRGTPRILFIGAPSAGIPLAVAAGLLGDGTGFPMGSRMMRTKPKGYGAHRTWIDGAYDAADFYVVVDNNITDGATKLDLMKPLVKSGYNVKEMYFLVLIDREQGGIENVRKAGYNIDALFDLSDICKAFGVLGLWSRNQLEAACKELVALRTLA